ncbi:MAG: FimB/Mfa2 family fimbrial subunit [Prevotella sp.]|jgi:hypothetical protein|nr:FimB/Mfa2 family fimbrial subunit [Prevotella sp.]
MYTDTKHIVLMLLLLFLSYSCANEDNGMSEEIVPEGLQLKFGDVSDNIRNYTDIYVFNGQDPKINHFNYKVLNVERSGNNLKMDMKVGMWNLVLVGCNEIDIRSKLISPVRYPSIKRDELPMWRTTPENNILPDVPEIRTALLDGVEILHNQDKDTQASLDRNVAKVRVVLADGVGFQIGAGHTFSLKNVPTTLAWDGSLYPKDAPETTSYAMTKAVSFSASEDIQGHQKSDTIDFIIPAHRSSSPEDISTHRITLGVNFITAGGQNFVRDIEIQTVPKTNKILLLNLTAKGGVEVKVDVKDWVTVYSSNSLDMYTIERISNTSTMATYRMNMKQERNWWVTLEDTDNFEFVDESRTFGQLTASPVDIQVIRRTAGGALSTKLNLHISGFDGLREQYDITDLVQ